MDVSLPAYDWKPRRHQLNAWRALRAGKRNVVLAWHRRAGKDEIALHHTAIAAMSRVGNYWHMLPKREQARTAMWTAVNPRTGRVRWKDAFPPEILAKPPDNQSMMLTFVNGSTWQLLGSDNYDSMVGTSPVGMVASEAALADPAAFAFFDPILLENKGWMLQISSVRGKNHFYRGFNLAQDDPEGFAELLSAEDTGIFSEEELAHERRKYVARYGAALGNALFEQEYLSRWEAAVVGAIWATELRALQQEGRAVPLVYDPRFPVITSWDLGVADETVILFWQVVGNVVRLIDWYSSNSTGLEHYAEVLAGKPYFYGAHIAPHDIAVREWGSGISRLAQAKQLGIHFQRMPNTAKADSISAAASLIARMEINVSDREVDDPAEDCAFVLEALSQYRFRFDESRRVMSRSPVHDWTSHYADALQTMAVYLSGSPAAVARRHVLQGRNAPDTMSKMRLKDIMSQPSVTGAFG